VAQEPSTSPNASGGPAKPSAISSSFTPLDMSIKQRSTTNACAKFTAAAVEYSPEAEKKIEVYTRQGFDKLR